MSKHWLFRIVLLAAALPSCGVAADARLGPAWQLPPGSVDALSVDRLWLFGRRASLRGFEAPGALGEVAAALVAQLPRAPTLQAMPDGVLIADMDGAVQWLLRLIAVGETRTRGNASAVDLRGTPELPAPAWLPPGAVLRLDVAARAGATLVRQQVLTDVRQPEALRQALCAGLLRQGWRPDDAARACPQRALAYPLRAAWRKGAARIELVIAAQESGSAAYASQVQPWSEDAGAWSFARLWRAPAAHQEEAR